MLTYTPNPKPRRKDRPWLLFITALIWISGVTFFHEPWEPYEPYIVAVVKSIIDSNSWLVPYISHGVPYLDLQPFYFWLFALIIKIFHFSNIANAIRLINALIIFGFIAMMGRIGSGLSAFKNGRSVVMILISSIGFINNAYQLTPNMVVLLGFALYFYALQQSAFKPGISAWILSVGLIFISLNFTCGFLLIALVILIILPLISRQWRNLNYFITIIGGILFFTLIFASYAWQLNKIDHNFYLEWKNKYIAFTLLSSNAYLGNLVFFLQTILWYLIPSWILVGWTFYKRGRFIFKDKILQLSCLFLILLFVNAILRVNHDESVIFPLLIPMILLASVEIDSIRINTVSLLNWFCIFTFGSMGTFIAILYIALNFGQPHDLLSTAQFYAPNYVFQFNGWQLALAILITIIWLFMITRKHIRGREMISNWASGTTFVLVMFISLCLPWFNSLLSFKDLVMSSINYIQPSPHGCVATLEKNRLQDALWYYYADMRLTFNPDIKTSQCNHALLTVPNDTGVNIPGWHVIWSAKRPVDAKRYVLIEKTRREPK